MLKFEKEKIMSKIEKRIERIEEDINGEEWDYPEGVVAGLKLSLKLIEEMI